MNLVFFGIHFSDIILSIISALVLASISFILFYIFKISNDKLFSDFQSNQQLSNIKKKSKKKSNSLKIIKNAHLTVSIPEEQLSETRHIEINVSPEILDDNFTNNTSMYSLLPPGKPILRKTEEKILVNKEECEETVWIKIPKDEVAILRSRHSSVVSEVRLEYKDDEVPSVSKLSRGQKKRLKAKLKAGDSKMMEIKNDIQSNNSALINFTNDTEDDPVENTIIEQTMDKLNTNVKKRKHEQLKNNSLTSSDSSQVSEKNLTIENSEKNLINDIFEDLSTRRLETDSNENRTSFNFQSSVDNFTNSEDKMKLEQEIKELKIERYNILQKLNDWSSMTLNIITLKKDNELYMKKYDDLERTCNAMKKELTSSIQKNTSIEGQFLRYKADKNQQFTFFENEMSKLRNKIVEQEHFKDDIDKLHHLVSEKDKHCQNQNIEISALKEQLYKKKMDCQDLESQIKNTGLNLKEVENQKQLAQGEIQKLIAQIESQKTERSNYQKQFEQFKRQSKAQEQQQDAIISSFQYQLDEFFREKQQCALLSPENNDCYSKSQVPEKQINASNTNQSDCNIPDGFQLIERSTIKKFTSLIKEGNQKLQEKCDQFNLIISEYKDKEANLRDENALLNDKYSKLNTEFKSHLNEIVHLRKCIETLQQELSKNSETNLGEMKQELYEKCDTLRQTEEILAKLESSVDEEEIKWHDSLNECRQENIKLENELKSQTSLLNNQNKQIIELKKLLQSSNISLNESMLNGALSDGSSEISNQ